MIHNILLICCCISLPAFTLTSNESDSPRLRMCVVENAKSTTRIKDYCPSIQSHVECITEVDRMSCLRRIARAEADFTLVQSEDVMMAASSSTDNQFDYNILITTELRLYKDNNSDYQMVLVANKNIKDIKDVKRARFCHPGYDANFYWTKVFASFFEDQIVPRECDPMKTVVENRMSAMSNFFPQSCVGGPWTEDAYFDKILKSKYKNLSSIAGCPPDRHKYQAYFTSSGAIKCLADFAGDIAWAKHYETLFHFRLIKFSSWRMVEANSSLFHLLCPDGSTRELSTSEPCFWIAKPWKLIAARREVAQRVAAMFGSINSSRFHREKWQVDVRRILEPLRGRNPVNIGNPEIPVDYLKRFPGLMKANTQTGCHPTRTVRWCVASNIEDKKCQSIRQAARVYGVEPLITCEQEASRKDCLESVKNGRTDMFVINPEETLLARRNGLVDVVEVFSNKNDDVDKFVAVVNINSTYKTLDDLRGARACFPGYGTVVWNSFVTILRNSSTEPLDCSDKQVVSNFFKESCVLNLDKDDDAPKNLRSLCKKDNYDYAEEETFDCLKSGRADVAFVNVRTVTMKKPEYRFITDKNEAGKNGIENILVWSNLGSVVTSENITEMKMNEMSSLLLGLDNLFGKYYMGQDHLMIDIYSSYDSEENVIFPAKSEQMQRYYDPANVLSRSYKYKDIVNSMLNQVCTPSDVQNKKCKFGFYRYNCLYAKLLSEIGNAVKHRVINSVKG